MTMHDTIIANRTAEASSTSITERTLNRIDSALAYLADTIGKSEDTFHGVLRDIPPASTDKATGEIKEVTQSPLHGSLTAILDSIEQHTRRLAALNARSTL